MTIKSTLIDLSGWSMNEDGSFHREGYVISNNYEIFNITTPDGSIIKEFDYCNGYSAIIKVNELIKATVDHISYGIHKYWVMNDGEVKHDDYANDCVDESNDFTWPHTCYTINVDLLPDDLKNGDDEDLAPLILAYHHKEIEKPNWIVE